MSRILPAALIALLIVAGGLWQGSRPTNTVEAAAVAQEEPQTQVPEGFRALSPLTETRRLTFTAAEDVLEEEVDYHAVLETSKGEIVIDLFEEQAPRTVNNFVFLALNRYFDGVPFHRVLEDFMAQTGDPTGTGTGGPGYTFEDEINADLTHDSRGVVSMANAGPDTNGSQFFITFAPTPWLDGRHAVFGRVIEGDGVLDELQRVDPGTPSAVIRLDETLAGLSAQGVELEGDENTMLRDYLEQELGALPAQGQSFSIDGIRGVIGRAGGVPAAGFFPSPDVLERVTVMVPDEQGGTDQEESR